MGQGRRVLRLAGLVAALGLLGGCGSVGVWLAGESAAGPTPTLSTASTVPGAAAADRSWKGEVSYATRPTFLVARTGDEWQAMWQLVGQPAPGALPDRMMALAIFIGPRTTSGYGVDIADARLERRAGLPDRLLVEYRVVEPSRDARLTQMLTSPYAITLTPRTDASIRYAKLEERRPERVR